MKKLLLTGIAALFLATGTAHTGEFPQSRIWDCGHYLVVVNPADLIWNNDRADFVRGDDHFTIWRWQLYQQYSFQGHLQSAPCLAARRMRNFPASKYVYLPGLPLVF